MIQHQYRERKYNTQITASKRITKNIDRADQEQIKDMNRARYGRHRLSG